MYILWLCLSWVLVAKMSFFIWPPPPTTKKKSKRIKPRCSAFYVPCILTSKKLMDNKENWVFFCNEKRLSLSAELHTKSSRISEYGHLEREKIVKLQKRELQNVFILVREKEIFIFRFIPVLSAVRNCMSYTYGIHKEWKKVYLIPNNRSVNLRCTWLHYMEITNSQKKKSVYGSTYS